MADLSTWVFRFGSIAYLVANFRCAEDVINAVQTRRVWQRQDVINLVAICAFSSGSLFYISGGIVGQLKLGAPSLMLDLWVIGSIGFAIGGSIFFKGTMGRAMPKKFRARSTME